MYYVPAGDLFSSYGGPETVLWVEIDSTSYFHLPNITPEGWTPISEIRVTSMRNDYQINKSSNIPVMSLIDIVTITVRDASSAIHLCIFRFVRRTYT
jgi:hypothetical protein